MNILDLKRKLLPLSGYMGDSGGGGGGAPAEKQTQVTELPEWARPYAKDTLAKGAALTDINQNPYQTYGANRIAGFSPMQQMSFQGAANMQPSQQLGTGTDLATAAGIGALGTNYQSGRFGGGMFGQGAADFYMNPYQQNVIDIGKREAARQSAIQGTQQQAQATQAGAFGGGRDAIMRAERERNLGQQMSDIQAQGSNAAFSNAQQQFNADQARRMQAQQLGEQSRQYGAGLGMQGLQTGLQAAGQLGQLGGQQFQQGMDINKLQSAYGGQMQQQAQRPLDQAYQDFLNQQNYPYKQLGFMSDLIRGLPLGQQSTSSIYQAPGSSMGQLAGLGMGAYGVSQLMRAEGGTVHDYAEGGVTSDQNVEGILSKLSDQQLQQARQGALARRDVDQANMIDAEISMRASARSGISAAITPEFADQMEEGMASGGIVAFADRGAVKETPGKATSTAGEFFGDITNYLSEKYKKGMEELTNKEAADEIRPGLFESVTPKERKEREARADLREKGTGGARKAPVLTQEQLAATSTSQKELPKSLAPQAEAPQVNVSEPSKPAPTKSLDRKYADISSGPKPSKAEVKSAVTQFAEQRGLSSSEKDDYMTMALKLRDELGKPEKPILDKLNAAIEAQKPDERAIKDRGIGQALAQFGFGMAERASRPGARFLESASGASPILASVAEKTNSLIDAKKENYTKMQLDQAKYEMALSQGRMQTAATLAGQINQAKQQDRVLDFNIAKAKDELALKQEELGLKRQELANQRSYQGQIASKYETVSGLAQQLMKDPTFKGTQNDAIAQAANMLKGGIPASIRAETSLAEARAKAIEKVDASIIGKLLAFTPESNPKYPEIKRKYEEQVKQQMQQLMSGGAPPGVGAPTASQAGANSGQWGDLRVKP